MSTETSIIIVVLGVSSAVVNIGIAIHEKNRHAIIGWICATLFALSAALK